MLWQLSGFESRYLPKIQNERHNHRSGQHTLARQKNIQKCVLTKYELAAEVLYRAGTGLPVFWLVCIYIHVCQHKILYFGLFPTVYDKYASTV
jgi:hypothetical protein